MKYFLIALLFVVGFVNCNDKTNNNHTTDNELITHVTIVLHDSDITKNDSTRAFWSDIDGAGGNNPILPDTLRIRKNTVYNGHIYFSNLQNGTYIDITKVIETENMNHILCYDVHSVTVPPSGLSIERTDQDKNGYQVGLSTLWKAQNAENGFIRVRLKHQPNIKNGSCDIGETDAEVDFPYVVIP